MTDDIKLLPCPFCGGEAEMDTRQAYLALGTGRPGNRIAVYCRSCDADMGVCIEDVPDITPEQVAEMWNRRAAPVAAQPSVRDVVYLGCARMGLAGASDDEVLNYVRIAAPTPPAVEQTSDQNREDSEHDCAIKEDMRNAACDNYFAARGHLEYNVKAAAFNAGFDRGWDAAIDAARTSKEPNHD